ncbi:MAG: hypothetical protein ACFFEY_00295 [Candidatus Thorarchaeota archaeon]
MIKHLPCKKCGSGLPIVKGSIAQCPYCEARNLYMESFYSFKHYLGEILNLTSPKIEKSISNSEFERRKSLINEFFYKLNSEFNEYRHYIITKLDNLEIGPSKLFNLIRSAGNLEIIIEEFLLRYVNDDLIRATYLELRNISYIINKSLLGLYYSYVAKNTIDVEKCAYYYHIAEKSYQNIVDYCNITEFENNRSKIYKRKAIYVILSDFAAILRGILNENPKYYSDKLEDLLDRLMKTDADELHRYNLYTQIEKIYQLERDTTVVLEKVKIDCPLLSTENLEENIIFNTEKNLEKLYNVQNWIKSASERYQKYQRSLLKLHSGKLIEYLESYREEFINYKNMNTEKFRNLLNTMIRNAFDTYNSESLEILNILSEFIQHDILNEKIIKRFEIEHKTLIELEELLNNFINDIFKKPLIQNLESDYRNQLFSIISSKHAEYDKHSLKYINSIIQDFEDLRSKKLLTLEQQKNLFTLNLKPKIKKLIELSFNLNEIDVNYPIFMDIKTENKKLKLDNPEVISVIIENPNLTDIKDLKVYFFMSDSFQSKLQYTDIKRLRTDEITKIKTKVIPRKIGNYIYMVMAEYQHSNKTFWMPSMKYELEVEKSEDFSKYIIHPIANSGFYQSDIEINRAFKFIRTGI